MLFWLSAINKTTKLIAKINIIMTWKIPYVHLVPQCMGQKVQFEAVAAIECIDCDTSCAGDCGFCPG